MCVIHVYSFSKPKTQRGKRFLQDREPKIFENTKRCMFIKGGNTSQTVTQLLKELVSINACLMSLLRCAKLPNVHIHIQVYSLFHKLSSLRHA